MRFRMRFAHILFYAGKAGERAQRAIIKMPRSVPVKAHTACRIPYTFFEMLHKKAAKKCKIFSQRLLAKYTLLNPAAGTSSDSRRGR